MKNVYSVFLALLLVVILLAGIMSCAVADRPDYNETVPPPAESLWAIKKLLMGVVGFLCFISLVLVVFSQRCSDYLDRKSVV